MSQLAQEKQVNLRTSARLNALSQYVLRISFSAMCGLTYRKGWTMPASNLQLV